MKIINVDQPFIAKAFCLGPYQRVYLGTGFDELDTASQEAVLAHEVGHIHHHHTEKRILCMLFAPFWFKKMCKCQEFVADLYAAQLGYAKELIALFSDEYDGGDFQPSHAQRRQALKIYDQTRFVPVKDSFA